MTHLWGPRSLLGQCETVPKACVPSGLGGHPGTSVA